MKLGNFFTKPKLPTTTSPVIPQSPVKELTIDLARRKSLSIEPADKMTTQSTTPKREQEQKSDYKRKFLPFQPPSYTTCAPHVLYPPDDAEVMKFDNILERVLKGEPSKHGPAPVSSFFVFGRPRSRGIWQPNAREVVESLNGSSHNPIDLESGETCRPEDLLKSVTIRHLHFAEDVRPPYVGSYTKSLSPKSSAKLRRRPCERIRKDTNYDYDSEAEWEEPEEGEDLLSDGEDDDESIGAPDEMEDFLDEDEAGPKRRLLTGDLKPTSTGLCWHGSGIANPESSIDMDSMKIEFFIGTLFDIAIKPSLIKPQIFQLTRSTPFPELIGQRRVLNRGRLPPHSQQCPSLYHKRTRARLCLRDTRSSHDSVSVLMERH